MEAQQLGEFTEQEIDGLPEVVQRYFRASIAVGTPLVRGARLTMRGRIRLQRWLSFEATEILDPHRGFVWTARVARGAISGSDSYVAGSGAMHWRLIRLVPLVSASGPDVSRSAAGRAAAEAVLSPIALLPRFGVAWRSDSPRSAVASWTLDDTPIELRCWFDDDARLRSISFDRWGDPDRTGTWGWHSFGGDLSEHRPFDGVTIPSAGRLGWFPGTQRWADGEFFRFEVTSFEPRAWADRVSSDSEAEPSERGAVIIVLPEAFVDHRLEDV